MNNRKKKRIEIEYVEVSSIWKWTRTFDMLNMSAIKDISTCSQKWIAKNSKFQVNLHLSSYIYYFVKYVNVSSKLVLCKIIMWSLYFMS